MRSSSYPVRSYPARHLPTKAKVSTKSKLIIGLAAVFVLLTAGVAHAFTSKSTAAPTVQSGKAGYCLDSYRNNTAPDSVVDTWQCNGSDAQAWSVYPTSIRHQGKYCLDILNNGETDGSKIVMNACNTNPGQVWIRYKSSFLNPNSDECLSLPDGKTNEQLVIEPCGKLNQPDETWRSIVPSGASDASRCVGTKGEKVACYAVQEWVRWTSGQYSHPDLLNQYTDGYPYESWCADFVSYVYREAGYPFTDGEADGWDENDANKVQYMGFVQHDPSDYTPKPGDIAFFDYDNGHVEIVVSGGQKPTFIYGNSATIDRTTGNGQMKANTIMDDGKAGKLTYYLSPL